MNNGQPPYDPRQQGHQYPPQQPYYPPQPAVNVVQSVVVQNGKRAFPHAKHLLISLLTCGAWAPFWLLLWLLD